MLVRPFGHRQVGIGPDPARPGAQDVFGTVETQVRCVIVAPIVIIQEKP